MKKVYYFILGALLMVGGTVFAAPYFNYSRTIIPSADSSEDLGTSTTAWRNIYTDQLCLSGDCQTSWSSGSGTISTSTPLTAGQVVFSTGVNTVGNSSQFYYDTTNDRLGLGGTPGTAKLYVNGNVGVGTTAPTKKLEVAGDAFITLGNGLFFRDTSSNYNYISSPATGELNFVANSAEVMRIKSGNVGIGTTSPQHLLSLANNGVNEQLQLEDTAAPAGQHYGSIGYSRGVFSFNSLSDAFATTSRMVIDKNGNVGIGTTGPGAKLEVNGTISSDGFGITGGAFLDSAGYAALGNGYNGVIVRSAGQYSFSSTGGYGGSADSAFSRLAANKIAVGNGTVGDYTGTLIAGNVGIGTTSPGQKLTVAGSVGLPMLSNDATGYYVCLNTVTGALATSTTACGASSIRYKENVQSLSATRGLDTVMAMKPVTFSYRPETKVLGSQIGFIAEDMLSLVPEAVGIDSPGLPSNIDYGKLTPVMVKAIQQMNLKIDSLATTTTTTDETDSSFSSSFFKNLFARISTWLASASNGLSSIFADAFHARREICVDNQCLNAEDVRSLLALARSQNASGDTGSQGLTAGTTEGTLSLVVLGNNPATISVGDSYSDLGAVIATSSVIFADGTSQNTAYKGTVFSVGRALRCYVSPAYDSYCDTSGNYSDYEEDNGNIMPFSGTLKNLYVDVFDSNNIDNVSTFTILKNGVATALTVSIASSTVAVVSDTTHTVSVSAGDRITLYGSSVGSSGEGTYVFSYVLY